MNQMDQHQSRDRLIAWVVSNLPDSIRERKQLLTDALGSLPARHPMRERISTLLTFLISHENQQLEFPIVFKAR